MNYLSLYRKYRPNNFDNIVDQKEIKIALKKAIINKSFSHAYLFAGPHGTGKTSIAKIFAKAINCLNTSCGNPCNNCQNCIEINKNLSIDIIEIDAASNNGVDEIREIRNNVQLLPIKTKYKVYIVDEIHMLTNSAFNALLKTLEEPPHHIVFILATTESYKIPETIISRCQQYNFRKISTVELENNIKNILKKENIQFELPAIKQISLLSNGSARDSLNILEQLIIFSDKKIILDNVNKIFATISKQKKIELLKNICEYKTNDVLLKTKEIYLSGTDFELLIINLLEILKEVLEYKQTNNTIFLSILTHLEGKVFAKALLTSELLELINLFIEMLTKMKINKSQEMYFELTMLKALSIFENNKKNLINLIIELKEINNEYNNNYISENTEINIKYIKENKQNIKEINNLFKQESVIPNEIEFQQNKKETINIYKNIENFEKYKNEIKNKINIYNFSNINYPMNQILNILIKSSKTKREEYENKFNKLIKEKRKNIKLEKIISFHNVKFVAGSEQGVIVITNNKPEANWISHEICDLEFRNKIFHFFNYNFIIIALSKLEWNNLKIDYIKLQQTNKLPKTINIDIEKFYQNILVKQIDNYDIHKNIIENGKKIFDNIKIID